jgi:putative two-component system response regulator
VARYGPLADPNRAGYFKARTHGERAVNVLVVDDLAYNVRTMRAIFQSAGYEVTSAHDGQEALESVRASRPDFIVTDVLMPRLDGFQLCRAIKTDPALAKIPVIFYTGDYVDAADREFGASLGAAAYLTKPLEPLELLQAVTQALGQPESKLKPRSHLKETFAAAYADRLAAKLQDKVTALNQTLIQLEDTYTGTVSALTLALAGREGSDPIEAARPARLAQLFCERVAPDLAADPNVFRGFLLHDIGKLTLPEGLLRKAGPLAADERALFERQPGMAADILRNVPGLGRGLEIVRHYHERWDGKGYPDFLEAEAIPLGARIFAICNAFDAITTARPYRPGRSVQEAIAELRGGAGTQFDPNLVGPFIAMVSAMHDG